MSWKLFCNKIGRYEVITLGISIEADETTPSPGVSRLRDWVSVSLFTRSVVSHQKQVINSCPFSIYRGFSYTLDSHSILEFSDSCFYSTFCRTGKWDLGDQRICLSWRPRCATCFPPKFAKVETKKWVLLVYTRICPVIITGSLKFLI